MSPVPGVSTQSHPNVSTPVQVTPSSIDTEELLKKKFNLPDLRVKISRLKQSVIDKLTGNKNSSSVQSSSDVNHKSVKCSTNSNLKQSLVSKFFKKCKKDVDNSSVDKNTNTKSVNEQIESVPSASDLDIDTIGAENCRTSGNYMKLFLQFWQFGAILCVKLVQMKFIIF
jgi:hypothetical protein